MKDTAEIEAIVVRAELLLEVLQRSLSYTNENEDCEYTHYAEAELVEVIRECLAEVTTK